MLFYEFIPMKKLKKIGTFKFYITLYKLINTWLFIIFPMYICCYLKLKLYQLQIYALYHLIFFNVGFCKDFFLPIFGLHF